ncbi:hypothetical protein RZS08_29625, partial [Arthrospira platensis SPKY1]|nr:hypothetical protein [Arthrospira platensis SPKY1]
FPGLSLGDLQMDEAFFAHVWLKYGGYIFADCVAQELDWLSSNEVVLLNSVVQIDDEEKLGPYNYADSGIGTKFLTSRPAALAFPYGSAGWLWIYAAHADDGAVGNIRGVLKYYDSAGAEIGSWTSPSTPSEGGVFVRS